jgi:DNA invertase Pin-like site-specific DNA recombinase
MFLEMVKRRADAAGFEFRCSDMPNANSFMLGVMAAVAQYEREQISERTRRALRAARGRGVKLGSPIGSKAFQGRQSVGVARAAVSHKARADEWASKRRDLLAELLDQGLSFAGIARELTAKRITTRRGGCWTARSVSNLVQRLELVPVAETV